jgi:hypothetical protein
LTLALIPDIPDDMRCQQCGVVHNPALCQGHAKNHSGGQCHKHPYHGSVYCYVHGGAARVERPMDHDRARKALGRLKHEPVENPLAELLDLAGEARAWKVMCAAKVAQLTSMRYGTDGGEAIRGEIVLFERAMDRCAAILALVGKLKIEERLAAITERQKLTIVRAIEAALAAIGADPDQKQVARQVAARHLRAVEPPDAA